MPKSARQHPLGDEVLRAIGQITADFTLLETLVSETVHRLVGGRVGPIVTAGMPFSKLLDLLSALTLGHPLRGWR